MEYSERIEHFSFWQPVVFTLEDNPGTTTLSKWGYLIGSLADQYASLSSENLQVNAERIDARKIYFEKESTYQVPHFDTALKVCSFACSFLILPALALVIKLAFKVQLNASRILTKVSPNEVLLEREFFKTKIVLLLGDLTEETTDVIVNAANDALLAGSGVCGAIHTAAGDEPFDECEEILKVQKRKHLGIGEAVLTNSGDLAPRVKAIAHAVGPDYRVKAEKAKGEEYLAAAYRNPLELVLQPKNKPDFISADVDPNQTLHSIAYPSISTGIFKAPLDVAAPLALETIKDFAEENPGAIEEVRFVFLPKGHKYYDAKTVAAFEDALKAL